MSEEEWTTVPIQSNVNRRRGRKAGKAALPLNHPSIAIQKALYNDTKNESSSSSMSIEDIHTNPQQAAQKIHDIAQSIRKCMETLEQHDPDGFIHQLLQDMTHILFGKRHDHDDNIDNDAEEEEQTTKNNHNNEYEIVCYGIGNFEKAYSAPMLQLACVLLVQKHLSQYVSSVSVSSPSSHSSNNHPTNIPQITIHYFEPLMTPLEQMILEQQFHNVHIISNNERGKRHVTKPTLFYMPHCPMRLYNNVLWANWHHIFPSSVTNHDNSNPSIHPNPNHNPNEIKDDMDHSHDSLQPKETIQSSRSSRSANATLPMLLFFGNSFHAYQHRTIQTSIDLTDGMSLAMPYCIEHPCFGSSTSITTFDNAKKKKKKSSKFHPPTRWHRNDNEILWNMEKAFNDSALVYYDCHRYNNNDNNEGERTKNEGVDTKRVYPNRPLEYIGKTKSNDGENVVGEETHPSMREEVEEVL